jgi:hypothetical protein
MNFFRDNDNTTKPIFFITPHKLALLQLAFTALFQFIHWNQNSIVDKATEAKTIGRLKPRSQIAENDVGFHKRATRGRRKRLVKSVPRENNMFWHRMMRCNF